MERILAQSDHAPHRNEPRCEVCWSGRPQYRTGAVLCDDCAPAAARLRAERLLDVESRSDDIFDVLNVLDNQIMNHDVGRLPETEQYRRWLMAQSACHWLVEQRVETASGGAAKLRPRRTATAARLRPPVRPPRGQPLT